MVLSTALKRLRSAALDVVAITNLNVGCIEPRTLLEVILCNADAATMVEAKEIKKVQGTPLIFDGPETLKVQFNLRKKIILDFENLHQIKTSWSEMMMECLLVLNKGEEFEYEV